MIGNPRLGPSGPAIALLSSPGSYDNGNSGAAASIDWSRGPAQKIVATANCTLDLVESLPEGESCRMMLQVQQDATGSRLIVLPFVKTTNNSDLVFSTTAGRFDLVDIYWDGHTATASFFAKNITPS